LGTTFLWCLGFLKKASFQQSTAISLLIWVTEV
jgi:hypothetical protein